MFLEKLFYVSDQEIGVLGQVFDVEVKIQLGIPTSHIRVPEGKFPTSSPGFVLMCLFLWGQLMMAQVV